MKKSLLLAIAGILAGGTIASAANLEGQYSVSPIIGGYTYDTDQPRKSSASMVYGVRAGYNLTSHIGFEGLFDYVDSSFNGNDIPMYRYGGELLYHLFPEYVIVPYLAVGYSGVSFDADGIDNKTHGAIDYGVGAKYFLSDSFALRADFRQLIYKVDSQTNNNFEYTLGAYIPFGGVKPVAKPVEPPPAPAPAPKAVEPPPAPAPPPPAAPTAALTITPATVTQGQPATLNWKSQYATGCEIQPGIGPLPPQGVRTITPAASTTYSLSCSGAGGTATSTAGVTVELPPPPPPVVSKAAERFCNKPAVIVVEFETGKATVKETGKYEAEVKIVSEFLTEFPKAKGEISGHTDTVGGKAYNDKLSQARADFIKKYLVDNLGVSADRITTKGYGFSKPIATNKTKAGRQLNRRIEANFTCE